MAFTNKGKVRILRGILNDSNTIVQNTTLWDGQPFYDKQSKHLFIGDGENHQIKDSSPIVADANNIVFNCAKSGNNLVCEIKGYKPIENQIAFLICNGNINKTTGQKLILNGINEDIALPNDGIKANNLYQLTRNKNGNVYSWEIKNINVEFANSVDSINGNVNTTNNTATFNLLYENQYYTITMGW